MGLDLKRLGNEQPQRADLELGERSRCEEWGYVNVKRS